MKQRKHIGAIINPAFNKFSDFLLHLGPCEDKGYTLDRLDNDDPEYGPGKVAWRDKYSQNSNKSNNMYLTHDDGRCHTVAQWAKITKQKAPTLYKRHENGWSDMEVITGKKSSKGEWYIDTPWPYGKEDIWEDEYLSAVCERGYNNPRLDFLREYAQRQCLALSKEKELLELVVHSKNGFDDPYNEDCFHSYVADKGYALKQYQDKDLSEITRKLDEVSSVLRKWENVFMQSDSLHQYTLRKKHLLKSKPGILTAQEFQAYLQLKLQIPEYTLHLAPH